MDIFDSSLGLEEQHISEGHVQGVRDGIAAGRREGRATGMEKGFELGQELGFYRGCARSWRFLVEKDPGAFTERAVKAIGKLEALIEAFPLGDTKFEGIQGAVDEIRSKFKAVTAMMGVQQEYAQDAAPGEALGF